MIPSVMPLRTREVLDALGEVLPEQSVPARVISADEDEGTAEHIRGVYRVPVEGNAKDDALDALEAKLLDLDWYEIRHHVCRHDEGGPCDPWQVERRGGADA